MANIQFKEIFVIIIIVSNGLAEFIPTQKLQDFNFTNRENIKKIFSSSTSQTFNLGSPIDSFNLTLADKTENNNALKSIDYPPEANAGPDVIVYLPRNNVTLNGSLSADDREIVAWEWTNNSNEQSEAVDMQNTRTPFLQISNLEIGIYTFVLKVTDASNQTSTAIVHVFVKPYITINLPQTFVILNGSMSSDDVAIKAYFWRQVAGPTNSIIANAHAYVANATLLTIGHYVFELMVTDENNNNATSRVHVTVIQEQNNNVLKSSIDFPPIANAGPNVILYLPNNIAYLNGSLSTDDHGIVAWKWINVSDQSDFVDMQNTRTPILLLSNLRKGIYSFALKVIDTSNQSSTSIVHVFVIPPIHFPSSEGIF